MPNTCDPRVKKAIDLAVFWHDLTARKGVNGGTSIPYIVHPIRVMELVWKWGAGTIDNMCAAICHDLKEDTTITEEILRNSIGNTSTDVVFELTFTGGDKAEYMKTFMRSSLEALIIKLADRICNVLDFALTDINYAGVYFSKAEVLFVAFYNRYDEISFKYGSEVSQKIEASIGAVRKMLFRSPINPVFSV